MEERWTRLLRYRLGLRETEAAQVLRTEPLKVRKVFSSSSSEKIGWRATKLMNLPSARLLPSMNSRSEMEVRTAGRRQPNIDVNSQKMTSSYKSWQPVSSRSSWWMKKELYLLLFVAVLRISWFEIIIPQLHEGITSLSASLDSNNVDKWKCV